MADITLTLTSEERTDIDVVLRLAAQDQRAIAARLANDEQHKATVKTVMDRAIRYDALAAKLDRADSPCSCDRPGYGCYRHGPQPREQAVQLGCGHKTWRIDGRCDQQHSKTTVLLGGDAA
jgi:hypothetical protein